jgi:integrase
MKTVGAIVERGPRRFAVVISRGRRPNGKPHQDWHAVTGSRDKAESLRRRLNVQIEDGTYESPSYLTVSDLLAEWETDEYPTIRPATIRNYQRIVRHLTECLGRIEVAKLKLRAIRAYRNESLKNGAVRRGPLAPKTVKDRMIVLRSVLDKAVIDEVISSNPMRGLPRTGGHEAIFPKVEQPEIFVFDEPEIATLLRQVAGHYLELPIRIALDCGLRLGEVRGLVWNDIDLSAPQVSVFRQRGRPGEDRSPTKTRKGLRSVPLGGPTVEILEATLAGHQRLCDLPGHGRCLVVPPGPDGSTTPLSLSRSFTRFLDRCGWKGASFHSLRHTFATRQIMDGTDVKTVSYWMGHCDAGFTLRSYTHWFDKVAGRSVLHRKRDLPTVAIR